jgi:hypothetical protein
MVAGQQRHCHRQDQERRQRVPDRPGQPGQRDIAVPDVRQLVPDQGIEQLPVAPAHSDRGRQHDARPPGRPVTKGIALAGRAPLDAGQAPEAGLSRQLGEPAASLLQRRA